MALISFTLQYVFMVLMYVLLLQHPFVTQLLTRNLVIELLDMANNPELHSSAMHSLDDNDLEVSNAQSEASHRPTRWFYS